MSLSQHWVRPIVRGKTNAAVEFGAKVSVSMADGYAQIERLDWNAYNEGTTLIESVERYRNEKGCYSARILGDKIYRTRENLSYRNRNQISMNGPKLGRPPKSKAIYKQQCLQEKSEAGEGNAVESKFGECKRTYGLNRIYAKRQDTNETSIYLASLVMNLEKRLRFFFMLNYKIVEKQSLSTISDNKLGADKRIMRIIQQPLVTDIQSNWDTNFPAGYTAPAPFRRVWWCLSGSVYRRCLRPSQSQPKKSWRSSPKRRCPCCQ